MEFKFESDYVDVDSETFYDKKNYSVSDMGLYAYTHDPRFDCYLVSIASRDLEYVGHPKNAPWEKIANRPWVSHNMGFDHAVINRLIELGIIPNVRPPRWHCSANLCVYSHLPRNLKGAVQAAFGETISKDVRDKDMNGKHWHEFTPEVQKRVLDYALDDPRWSLALWEKFSPAWPETERLLSELTYRQGERGFYADKEGVEHDIQLLERVKFEAVQKIPWRENYAILSHVGLAEECRKVGIVPPASLAMNDEACAAWEETYGDTYPWVAAMRDYRRSNALLEKFKTLRDRIQPNGRMSYSLLYFGSHTGRWSGSGGFNCVTGDHEVLTKKGWVSIDGWNNEEDEIAQWDSGAVSFVKAGKIVQQFTGGLVDVSARDVSISCTPNHRVLHKSQNKLVVKTAQAFQKSELCIPTAGILRSGESILSENQVRLMVALAADGTEIVKRGKKNGAVMFGFKKPRKIERLRTLLKLEGIKVREFVSAGITSFYIAVKDRPAWWKKGFGPWVLSLGAQELKILTGEIVHWDGFENQRSKQTTFCTVLKDQAEWVKTAAHLSGLCASLLEYKRPTSSGSIYHVYFKQSSDKFIRSGKGSTVVKTTPFSGLVYCPSVPSSFWLVRHRGKIHVTGNCQNLPREPFYFDKNFSIIRSPAKLEEIKKAEDPSSLISGSVDMRSKFVAAPGKKLLIADFNQIEARITPWLAGDKETLALARKGISVYEVHARKSMGWTGGSLKKEDPKKYLLAKIRVLGLGFGCGHEKFLVIAKQWLPAADFEAIFLAPVSPETELKYIEYRRKLAERSEDSAAWKRWLTMWRKKSDAERFGLINSWVQVTEFRSTNPKIVALWKQLDTGLKNSIGSTFEVELPSGRVMRYFNVNDTEGSIQARTTRGEHFNYFYGGKICENIVQATARDVFGDALLRVEKEMPVIMHTHDEIIVEVEESFNNQRLIDIMTDAPAWAHSLPLGVELVESKVYLK